MKRARGGLRLGIGVVGAVVVLLGVVPEPADAQEFRGRRPPRAEMPPDGGEFPYDGRLTFARIRFETRDVWSGWSGGAPPWAHDYPVAERNFMQVLSEITSGRPRTTGSRVVAFDDPDVFRYPIAYVSEPGHWRITDDEVAAMRAYLAKGGFIIFDDFAGRDWTNFEAIMRRVLPDVDFIRMPPSHPLFSAFFDIESLDMRHPYRGAAAEFIGIFEDNDPSKRLLAIANYNNDIGDYFEYSATGWYPMDASNTAYKLGINYWVWALTH